MAYSPTEVAEMVRTAIATGKMIATTMELMPQPSTMPSIPPSIVSAVAQGVQDFAQVVIQGVVIDNRRKELPYLPYTPMELSLGVQAKELEGKLLEIPELVFKKIYDTEQDLLSAWKAGIGAGMGSSVMNWLDQFANSNQLIYAFSTLQYQISVIPRMRRYWMRQYTPTVPDAKTAWQLYTRGNITLTKFRDYASYEGWDAFNVQLLEKALYKLPTDRTAFDMYLRGQLSLDDVHKKYYANAWQPEWHPKLDAIFQSLPASHEAFRLMKRGSITTAKMKSYMLAQGYLEDTQTLLPQLYEHIPNPHEAYTAFMRGKIGREAFYSWVQKNEYQNGMGEFFYNIYQRLPTAHEAFYLWTKGLISVSARDFLYRAAGYDASWHALLTANYYYIPTVYDITRIADYVEVDTIWATKILTERGLRPNDIAKIVKMLKIRPLRDEIRQIVADWVYRYRYGWVTPTDLEAALQSLLEDGYIQSTEKTLTTEYAELQYEDELMLEKISIYSWYFKTAVITEAELLQDFLDLGIREEKANLMVENLKAQGYYGYY